MPSRRNFLRASTGFMVPVSWRVRVVCVRACEQRTSSGVMVMPLSSLEVDARSCRILSMAELILAVRASTQPTHTTTPLVLRAHPSGNGLTHSDSDFHHLLPALAVGCVWGCIQILRRPEEALPCIIA